MKSTALLELEKGIDTLSTDEQLLLFKQLAQRLRVKNNRAEWEAELAAMAADPDIQREVREINQEFLHTEQDGLENI